MSPVPGAEDIEREYQYWIDFGAKEEHARIVSLLKLEEKRLYDHGKLEGSYLITALISMIEPGEK